MERTLHSVKNQSNPSVLTHSRGWTVKSIISRVFVLLLVLFTFVGGVWGQTFFGVASTPVDNGTNTTSPTVITPPTSMMAGDLVVVYALSRVDNSTIAISATGGQTWSAQADYVPFATCQTKIFWCRFNGTWNTSPSVSFSNTTCISALMVVYRPSSSTNYWAIDNSQVNSSNSGTVGTITGITTTKQNNVALAFWGNNDDNTWGTLTGTGWSKTGLATQYRNTSGSDISITHAYYIQTSSTGSTGDVAQTASSSDDIAKSIISFYEVKPPTITSFTPSSECANAGTTVTITGTNFSGTTAVQFNGTNAASFSVVSSTSITAVVPSGASTGAITVTNAAGTGTSSTNFTINSLPTVGSSVTESSGTANDGTVCNGTSVTLAGTGASSYTWTAGITDNAAFIPSSTTTYTVTGTAANGCTNTSSRTITVNTSPSITGQPANQSVTTAQTATFTVTATGTATLNYSWEEYNGTSWSTVSNGGVYSGQGTATLTITNPTYGMNGRKYRCTVSNACTPSVTSNGNATLNVSLVYCAWTPSTLSDGITRVIFNTIDNSTVGTNAYTNTGLSTTVVRGSSYPITVNVNTGGSYTNNQKVWIDWNQDGTFNTTAGTSGGLGEEYNLGSANGVTNGISSLCPLTITIPATATLGTTRMRVVSKYSTAALSCYASAADGEAEDYNLVICDNITIVTQPSFGSSYCALDDPTITVSATTSSTPLSYQWQVYSGGSWTNITSAGSSPTYSGFNSSATLTLTNVAESNNGLQYRCVITNDCGASVTSNAATLTVNAVPGCAASLSPANAATNQSASGVTLSWSAGTGSPTGYDVYFGTSATPPLVSSNQAGTSYATGALSGNTLYYWKVVPKSACGDASSCSTISFQTQAACTAPTFTTSQTNVNCFGASTGSITVTASGGVSSYQYSKNNGTSWQSGNSFSSLNSDIYNVKVKGGDGCISSAQTVTISQPASAVTADAGADITACSGTSNTLGGSSTASGGTSGYTYSWASSPAGFSSSSPNPTASPSATTTYTVTVTDAVGCTGTDAIVVTVGSGSTKTWVGLGNGGTGTDLNDGTKWSPAGVPSACDDVVIPVTSGPQLTMSGNLTIKSLSFTLAGNTWTPTLSVGANTLTVLNNVTIDVTSGNSNSTIHFGNYNNSSAGTVEIRGDLNIGTSSVYYAYLCGTNTTFNFKGNATFGVYGDINPTYRPKNILFDGTSSQSFVMNQPSINNPLCSGNFTVGSTNSPTVTLSGSGSTTLTIGGNLGVGANATLDVASRAINRSATGGSFTCGSGSTFKLSGTTGGQAGSNFPLNFSTTTLSPTSTVEYYAGATATQTVYATPTYGNLTISTSGTKTAGNNLNVDGTVTINTPATFVAGNFTHNVAGSWVNNGTFTQGTSTVIFDGSSTSLISGSNTFNNLSVNGGSALEVTLQNTTTVNGTLTLTTGFINLGAGSVNLEIGPSGLIAGGTASSFVITPGSGKLLQHDIAVGSAAGKRFFPIGNTNASFTPMSINLASGSTTDDFSARVLSGVRQDGFTGTAFTSQYVDRTWDIHEATAGGTTASLSLFWNSTGETLPSFNPSSCYITHFLTAGGWDLASATTASLNGTQYSVLRNGITSFSPYSVTSTSALPVELTSFQANCSESNTVDVTWSTASEHNSNYFRVDKSRNGTEWDVLGTIGAAGNSTYLIDYSLTDYFPNPGINYYRLFQYDMDGTFTTYDIQAAVCKEQQAGTTLSTHPNPSARDFNVDLLTDEMEGNGTLVMSDAKGSVVYKMEVNVVNGTNNFLIQNFDGQSGMYYITVKVGDKTVTAKHSMR